MTTTADLRAIADSRSTLYKLLSRLYLEEVDAETLKALCALQLENAPEAIAEPAARLRARCEAILRDFGVLPPEETLGAGSGTPRPLQPRQSLPSL